MDELVHGHVLTAHALAEMARRGVDLSVVASIIARPEQRLGVRPGRDVLQSRVRIDGKAYVVRVFVDVDRSPPEVVTVYRTSKIGKYWSGQS
jgi:hypothetical protein